MFALAGVTLAALASAARGQAIIGTNKLVLGVGEFGNLNIPYKGGIPGLLLPATDPLGINSIGLRVGDGSISGLEQGCLCEAWGVGVASKAKGPFTFLDSCGVDASFADNVIATRGGFSGEDGGKRAKSSVICGIQKKIQVTHNFVPSSSKMLFQVKVTIKNLTKKPFPQVLYRRAMDWDVDPTPFSEFVTIKGTGTKNYDSSNDNGFCLGNPSIDCTEISPGTTDVDFVDSGPVDHGAQFRLKFGKLNAGESVSFTTYYGVAPDEKSAKAAIKTVGAKLYSFGQSSVNGKPATFIWAYKGDKSIKPGKGFLPGLDAPPPPAPGAPVARASVGPSAEERQKSNSG
jgi:hypothetical protein